MTTGGIARAAYLGIGSNDSAENYYKEWVLQEVTLADVPTEVAELMTRANNLAEQYGAMTKGALLSCQFSVNVPVTPPHAQEPGAYKNRAAAISGTVDGSPEKKVTVYIQAASDEIFVGNSPSSTIVEVGDPAVASYFLTLNQYATVSDGEIIHEDPVNGYRLDRKNSTRD